ncbi:MAG: hypothetical protein WCL39_07835 [Armatimonadota bacterium]
MIKATEPVRRVEAVARVMAAAVCLFGVQPAVTAEGRDTVAPQAKPSSVHAVYETTGLHQEALGLAPFQTEVWYRTPGSLRASDKGKGAIARTQLIHKNGHLVYRFGRATVWPISQQRERPWLLLPVTDLFDTVESMIRVLGHGAHLAGEEEILGRKCDVVEETKEFRVSIDRATGIVARETLAGSLSDTRLVVLDLDQPIDGNVFESVVPSSAPLYKAALSTCGNRQGTFEDYLRTGLGKHRPITAAKDDLRAIISEDRVQKRSSQLKAIYWPSYVPSRFRFLKAKPMSAEMYPISAALKSYKSVESDYADPKTGDTIIFIQSTTKWAVSGEHSIKSGSFTGSLASGDDPFPFNILSWQRNGVYFTLAAANVQEPELVKIAQSLKAVQRWSR